MIINQEKETRELQQTLQGGVITTNCDIPPRMTSNGWSILSTFCYSDKVLGMGRRELYEKYKQRLHMNTIDNTFRILLSHEYISLKARNVGLNKRKKFYVVTEKGIQAFKK